MLAAISDEALITINSLELIGIVYLAIAISNVRERIARLEATIDAIRKQNGSHP